MAKDQTDFARRAGIGPESLEKFIVWRDLLVRWNARINLVGASTLSAFWTRHALDSVQVFRSAPVPGRWIDLGAGAGFPGLAVAFLQAELGAGETYLVESNKKKAAFLREVVRQTAAPATVKAERWQDLEPAPFDAVTARAFAPLPELLEAAFTFWGGATIGVFPKGRGFEAEIEAARRHWRFDAQAIPSMTGDGAILIVRELQHG